MTHTKEDILHAYPEEEYVRFIVMTDHTDTKLEFYNEMLPFHEAGLIFIHHWIDNTFVLSDSSAEFSMGVIEDIVLSAPPSRLVDVRDIYDNEYHAVVYYGELG